MRVLLFIPLLFLFDSLLRFLLLCLRVIAPARQRKPNNKTTRGCVVLIAAHDEAGTIGPTVAALREYLPEWPGSTLWVVADRCTDDTANEAAAAGAQVAARGSGKLGKGAVIAWWLQQYDAVWQLKDAVLILDADTKIAPGTLSALRQVMADGADAAQAFVAPDASTNSGRLAGWSEVLMQRIDDEARRRCGWPVPLRGTGWHYAANCWRSLLQDCTPTLKTWNWTSFWRRAARASNLFRRP